MNDACIMLKEMKSSGLANTTTYNIVINVYSKDGNTKKAAMLFQDMVESDTMTYTSLLRVTNGRLDKALLLFGKLPSHKLAANTITYNTIIHGLCSTNRFVDALTLVDEMREKGVLPNRVTYNVIVRSLLRRKKLIMLVPVLERYTPESNPAGHFYFVDARSIGRRIGRNKI
ncbi:pentatricopeptide repeat-containing protein At1g64583, mitochondrial-like [Salvia hispanica]|uniref:pentatricopeptide repeat-containing protein At1g64583, mitochondrial-like n=1 Tax=Salvia hispanica TaxID=49212 RepID=UPI00200990A8|nr:pentatricopeptide repeat-containing protein At1g64583, mitochondrial-like [Salvia hispanica]